VPRAFLIVNPRASRVTPELTERIADELRRAGQLELVETRARGHAQELAASAARQADRIYVYAGDGGFNEVLNGLEADVPVGFLPGGGTSVLPRALGLPRDALECARALAQGSRLRRISLGRVNGRRFAFSASLGLDAAAVRLVDERGRTQAGRRPGDVAFLTAAARLLRDARGRIEPQAEVVGHGRAAWILVANADPYTYLGRLPVHVAPKARFELGLDLVAPRRVRVASVPRFLAYAFLGRGQERAGDLIYLHDRDRIEVRCDQPLPLQADGEDLGDVATAVFEAERDAVSVLVTA
jgi:diacylglycerol kinase family enzyme